MDFTLTRFGNRLWRSTLDVLTPSLCLGCGLRVSEPASLCLSCWSELKHLDEPVCDMLGTPFAYDQGEGMLSPAALVDPAPWDRSRAAVLHDDTAVRLVSALKYNDRQEAGLLMARLMARAGRRLVSEADVIVPVPLHWFRLWRRRYNQSAFLAAEIAAASGKPWRHDLLQRRRATRAQVGLQRNDRLKNVKGAFRVAEGREPDVAGKTVLLVDDVRTTGATAGACARALKDAGAGRVSVLTFSLVAAPTALHI